MVIIRDEYVWESHRDTIYVRIQDIRPAISHPSLQTLELAACPKCAIYLL